MNTARIFKNGQSQAIRLPKEFRFSGDKVGIRKVGDIVYLFPEDKAWDLFMQGVDAFDDGFSLERLNDPPEREVQL
jgi:antitoxin VapB